MPCRDDEASTPTRPSAVAHRPRRSSRATASMEPTTISTASTTQIRYAVSGSSAANGANSTVSSGGLRFVSFADVA